jgi:hypothetical protein
MTDNIREMLPVTNADFKNNHAGFRITFFTIDAVDRSIGIGHS